MIIIGLFFVLLIVTIPLINCIFNRIEYKIVKQEEEKQERKSEFDRWFEEAQSM